MRKLLQSIATALRYVYALRREYVYAMTVTFRPHNGHDREYGAYFGGRGLPDYPTDAFAPCLPLVPNPDRITSVAYCTTHHAMIRRGELLTMTRYIAPLPRRTYHCAESRCCRDAAHMYLTCDC